MTKEPALRKRLDEFFRNVWNHADDEFQASFDERRKLNADELNLLSKISSNFEKDVPDVETIKFVRAKLLKDAKLIEVLLQVCGLTRNKILQDLKASSGAERRNLRLTSHLSLAAHDATWLPAGVYLLTKMRRVLHTSFSTKPEHRIFEAINQATWPGYIRQERAKRSGHEAEYRIATLLSNCGIPFEPKEKADNPLCRDAQWHDVSFDIIIPDISSPLVCVKSTVHTANIGQYGESKDHLEVDEARRMIDAISSGDRPTLVAFIDGVGFESNRAGLVGVLEKADEFCQFKTIWKLVVIACYRMNQRCALSISAQSAKEHAKFLERYKGAIKLVDRKKINSPNDAGEGVLEII